MDQPYQVPDKTFLREVFDAIAPRYDLLNQVLSFGRSEAWRRRSAKIVLSDRSFNPRTILDIGCGTGKFLECFLKRKKWESAFGLDLSAAMLEKARETIFGRVTWLRDDFEALPFLRESFDLVISAFTLRSIQKLPEFLDHVRRILTPGGKAVFLDLTRPRSFWVRCLFLPYLKFVLPFLGGLVSGNAKAYEFLSASVRHFQDPAETLGMMRAAGYRNLKSKSFAFGAATLIIGQK